MTVKLVSESCWALHNVERPVESRKQKAESSAKAFEIDTSQPPQNCSLVRVNKVDGRILEGCESLPKLVRKMTIGLSRVCFYLSG